MTARRIVLSAIVSARKFSVCIGYSGRQPIVSAVKLSRSTHCCKLYAGAIFFVFESLHLAVEFCQPVGVGIGRFAPFGSSPQGS